MRRGVALLTLVAALAVGVRAQGAAQSAAQGAAAQGHEPKPVAALAWLVGGVWSADATKMGGGMKRMESRYEWSDNGVYIRFNTRFVTDKATLHVDDGNFFWNPEAAALAMWYTHGHEIMQGPVKIDGGIMTIMFRAKSSEEKDADFRVTISRKTNDHYDWLIEEETAGGWKQLQELEYLRTHST